MPQNTVPNQLIYEKSPYLLQHAYNPVAWFPWGEEAFAKARREDKPVFLSIGYSTCHWCHVMERESFADEEVAAVLNARFVAVKVDREERPDVDGIYMTVCQMLTGQGGWPLTALLTADKQAFFVGTYFPKRRKWGKPGLLDVLAAADHSWRRERRALLEQGEAIGRRLRARPAAAKEPGTLTADLPERTFAQLARNFDAVHGGFSAAPKFPTPHYIWFLLRYWRLRREPAALAMAFKTLTAMRQGGIYDQLGYGFARYATDEQWLTPHFEKMLYDNALLCMAYLEAYQCGGGDDFARVAKEIITYVRRDMTDASGAFYAAEDADSEGVEGKFYVFSQREIMAELGEEDGAIFGAYYGISAAGNFEDGANILNTSGRTVAGLAERLGLEPRALAQKLDEGRRRLLKARKMRTRPHKDDKILTAWNALMIAALAMAGRVLQDESYLEMAERALAFIRTELTDRNGRLLARYRDGEARFPAYLDDHAFLLWALLELYDATFRPTYLREARRVAWTMRDLFWDGQDGGFFFTGADGEALPARPKELYDGAVPSGNSVAALSLLRLARLTEDDGLARLAARQIEAFLGQAAAQPLAHVHFMTAAQLALTPPRRIVVAGASGDGTARDMLRRVQRFFLPDTAVLFYQTDRPGLMDELLPGQNQYTELDGRAAAYCCEDFACAAPVATLAGLEERLAVLFPPAGRDAH